MGRKRFHPAVFFFNQRLPQPLFGKPSTGIAFHFSNEVICDAAALQQEYNILTLHLPYPYTLRHLL